MTTLDTALGTPIYSYASKALNIILYLNSI